MTLPTGDEKLPLNVRLVKHTGAVTPGTLTGALNFVLTYE
jgi:type 1 fimbria pilin